MLNAKTAAAPDKATAAKIEPTPSLYPILPLNGADRERFLALIPVPSRNRISQAFLRPVRAGEIEPKAITRAIAEKLYADYKQAEDAAERDTVKSLLEIVTANEDTANDFARYCLAWERLPAAEKRTIKNQRAAQHIAPDSMQGKPVTDAQLWKLRKLGSNVIPTDRAEASCLINGLLHGKGGRK